MPTLFRRFALVCGLALASLALDRPALAQTPGGLDDFRAVFVQLDANGDTILDRDEIPEKGRAAFDRLLRRGDSNQDGKLDVPELQALAQKVRAVADPDALAARLEAADSDGDGKVSRKEFPGLPARFDRLDADSDGFLTRDEIAKLRPDAAAVAPAAAQAQGKIAPRLAAMDKDGDGRVSRDEFTGPAALFDRLDTNGDGHISPEDRRQARPSAKPGASKP